MSAVDGASRASGTIRGILINALLTVVSFAVMFGVGELIVRALYKESTVLFPRYHTDYRYGPYVLRGNRPNAEFWHTSVDGKWRFVTNSRGFRDTREFAYGKPDGTLRVLSIGDSHTQGHEVRQEATFSAVLERYLNRHGLRAEVLNAGVSGFSTAEELAFLENEGVRYAPDVVVLGFYANDFQDNLKANLFRLEDDSLSEVKREHIPGVRIQNVIYSVPGVNWLSENSYFYSLLFNNVWQYFKLRLGARSKERESANRAAGHEADSAKPQAAFEFAVAEEVTRDPYEIELASALLARMQRFCRERGIRLVVVDIPARPARYEVRSSFPARMLSRLNTACIERVGSLKLAKDYVGAVDLHVPNGYNHISEFMHGLIGVEVGKRLVSGARAAPTGAGPEGCAPF